MTAPRPPVGGGPVRLGPRIVGEPVRTPWDQTDEAPAPTVLDDLGDVESPAPPLAAPPAVLVRGSDGVYRPEPVALMVAEHQRGDVTHYVIETPTAAPPDVRVGEHVVVLAGPDAGDVYRLED